MNQPTVFQFNSNAVRTFANNKGEPWFNASDVCAVLGYRNPWDAVSKHCRQGGLAKREVIDGMGRTQEATFINEGNLYRLIIKSRKPEAQRFEVWVCDEVLPSLRKTGHYVIDNKPVENLSKVSIPTTEYVSLLRQSAELWRLQHRKSLIDQKEAVVVALLEHSGLSQDAIAAIAGAESYEVAFVSAMQLTTRLER